MGFLELMYSLNSSAMNLGRHEPDLKADEHELEEHEQTWQICP